MGSYDDQTGTFEIPPKPEFIVSAKEISQTTTSYPEIIPQPLATKKAKKS
jgi:hypothetical protein